MAKHILALDQGTTSSRAIVYGHDGRPVATAQQEFEQIFPQPGHVEHNPEAIWSTQLATAQQAIEKTGDGAENIAALGITNQRETTVLWERDTGKPIGNAIVWQSRITAGICDELKAAGLEQTFRDKTGLVIDAYFSGTKIKYILDQNEGLRQRAEKGEILFGTIDTYLIWKLTGGKVHATDYSNASRTLIYNIHTLNWDDELLKILDIPRAMLPEVKDSSGVVGETDPSLFGTAIPIAGIAGDQQAATFGQGCFEPGTAKNTYGTGCFVLLNTGSKPMASNNGLLTTIGWGINGEITYCLEGAIFIGGAVIQWLRDGLQIVENASESEALATSVESTEGVYCVPAFVGLGAPYWDQQARGTIIGITRGTSRAHIVRSALESIAYQTCDVLKAMQDDASLDLATLKVDGGASANNFLMQFQSDMLNVEVQRPVVQETTALGAAYLAGLAVGYWEDKKSIQENWALDKQFTPNMAAEERDGLYHNWKRAVDRSLDWEE